MSGTSLDGIDLCYAKFSFNGKWSFTTIYAETYSYSKPWSTRLKQAVSLSKDKLDLLNIDYTHYLANQILKFITTNTITTIDAVCSHGHTILHQPEQGITLQIGNLPSLAKAINQTVVCNFRIQDVKLGGQGAPLVPIGDALLFSDYDFCLNLGGFANVSTQKNGIRIAYDICPVNTVLNHYAESLGLPFDDKGKIASQNTIHKGLLAQLNASAFYKKVPPKSLGIEWVHTKIFPLLNTYNISTENIIATYTEHCAIQIGTALQKLTTSKTLATGGGVYNTHLINRIKYHSKSQIIIPNATLVNYKEALVFGLLGVLKLRQTTNVLASVTGASSNHCAGYIFKP